MGRRIDLAKKRSVPAGLRESKLHSTDASEQPENRTVRVRSPRSRGQWVSPYGHAAVGSYLRTTRRSRRRPSGVVCPVNVSVKEQSAECEWTRRSLSSRAIRTHGPYPRQGHGTGARGAFDHPRTRVTVSSASSWPAWSAGSGAAQTRHGDLRAWLFLAPSPRLSFHDDAVDARPLLAGQVQSQRGTRSADRRGPSPPWLVGDHGVGVPAPAAGSAACETPAVSRAAGQVGNTRRGPQSGFLVCDAESRRSPPEGRSFAGSRQRPRRPHQPHHPTHRRPRSHRTSCRFEGEGYTPRPVHGRVAPRGRSRV